MPIVPMAGRKPNMAYLRVETANLVSKTDDSPSREGLITPSSAYDGTRSSIASSSWSSLSQISTTPSHSSSVASFQSSQEPSTPPHHEASMDFSFLDSKTSYDDFSLASEATHRKDFYLESHVVLQSSPATGDDFCDLNSDSDWVQCHQNDSYQQRIQFDSMMSTSSDFQSNLGASLNHSLGYPRSWLQHHDIPTFGPSHGCGYRDSSFQSLPYQSVSMYNLPPALGSILLSSVAVDDSTIVPVETVLEDVSPISDRSFEEFNGPVGLPRPHSECAFSPRPYANDVKEESSISDSDDGWQTPATRTMVVKRSGAKGVKREERASSDGNGPRKVKKPASKRRARKTTTTFSSHLNTNVLMTFQKVPRSRKKYVCDFLRPNGGFCTRPFERVEHLKRHQKTHEGQRDFVCPVPEEMKCNKSFGRRDNWRDHLKTHLSITSAGRNIRMEFGDMFDLVRATEEREEATKTIKTLLEWKAQGKHMKSVEPTVGRGRF
jgi:hypothetical protein